MISICEKTQDPIKKNGWLIVCIFMIAFGLFVLGYTIYIMVVDTEATSNN